MNRRSIRWVFAALCCGALAVGTTVVVVIAAPGRSSSAAQQLIAAKQQRLAQIQGSMAAAPVATKPPLGFVPSFAPCVPIPMPTAGVDNSQAQVGPEPFDLFVAANQWSGFVGGPSSVLYRVWAGVTGGAAADPGVPAVAVATYTWSTDNCTVTPVTPQIFMYPAGSGPLTITTVSAGVVELEIGSANTPLYFGIADQQFAVTPPTASSS
jgi:hypothetical protein